MLKLWFRRIKYRNYTIILNNDNEEVFIKRF